MTALSSVTTSISRAGSTSVTWSLGLAPPWALINLIDLRDRAAVCVVSVPIS